MIKNFKNYRIFKPTSRKLLLATLAFIGQSQLSANSDVSISKNLFLQRAFSANTTRELLMEGHIISTDFDGFYSFFSMDGAYQHSWNQSVDQGIGAFPFWSGTNVMTVGTNNGQSNLDAYQFGLGNIVTPGAIELNPIVYQGGADFLLYFGSSSNDPGMFLKFKVPLGIIGINPQLTEVPAILPNPAVYAAGALSLSNDPVNDPALTMTQAFAGNLVGGQLQNGSDFVPMQYGLINGTQLSGTQFGDFEMALGYNFICNEDHLFGIAFRAAGPSANKPTGQFLLEPIFGRGGSWCVGGYIVGRTKLWENHENSYLNLNVMATILHLVKKTDTIRSYDLTANGPGSKYLLVADFAGNAYQGIIQNLINVSTLSTNSSFSAEGDVSIDVSYVNNGWSADFGYDFWGRTQEILSIAGQFPANRYAILGRQPVGDPTDPIDLCQPSATINVSAAAQDAPDPDLGVLDATVPSNRIGGNYAFNVEAAEQSSASTSKLFARASYSWLESHFSPHLGVAGEFEISTAANNALPQWAVSLIGGLYF